MTQIAMKFVQWDVPELENWKIARFTNYGNVLIMATSWVGKKRTGSPAMWKSAAISKRYRFNGLPFWLLRCSQTVFRETTRTYCRILYHWQNRTTFCPIWSNWRYNRSTIKIKRSMKVTIEHSFCPYCDEVTELYFRIINTILFSGNEAELRESMRQLEKKLHLMNISHTVTVHDTFGFASDVPATKPKYSSIVLWWLNFNDTLDKYHRLAGMESPISALLPFSFYNFFFWLRHSLL